MTLKTRRPLRTLLPTAALLLAANAFATDAPAAPVASDWILEKLARPAPMRTAFVELRGSPLLKAPLRVSGEYRRPDTSTLVREVRAPYAETTTIDTAAAGGGAVVIERPGKSARRFALSRAPELASLQSSFGALLSGNRDELQQHYRIAADGTRQRWTLVLTPIDAAVAKRVANITLYGQGAELRCIETTPVGQPLQRTLLASAARAADASADAARLAGLCRGGVR